MATIDLGKIQPLWRGEFSPTPASNYEPLDQLSYLDIVYVCIQEADGSQLPTDTAYFKPITDLTAYKLQSILAYVTSQYANGDDTKVAAIVAGLPVAAYDYLVYPDDLRVYAKGAVTGTFGSPLDFDGDTGTDNSTGSTLSGALSKIESQLNNSVSITMADATYTLNATEQMYKRIEINGTLTAEQELVVGSEERFLTVKNNTAFAVKVVCVGSGNGVHVEVGEQFSLRVEGGDVVSNGVGNRVNVVNYGFYSSGTYLYSFGLTNSDVYQLEFLGGTATNSVRGFLKLPAEHLATSWVDVVQMGSATVSVSITITKVNSTSFSLSDGTGGGGIVAAYTYLNDGVTY